MDPKLLNSCFFLREFSLYDYFAADSLLDIFLISFSIRSKREECLLLCVGPLADEHVLMLKSSEVLALFLCFYYDLPIKETALQLKI